MPYQYESAKVYIWPSILNPSHLPPHPIPLDSYRAPVLGALHHTSNLHWLPILHMVMYVFQCYSLKLSHLCFSLSQGKILRWHHCGFRLGFNPVTDVFIRDIRGRFDTQSCRQEAMGWWRQRLEGCGHKSGKAWGPPKMEEARMDSEIINSYCWSCPGSKFHWK